MEIRHVTTFTRDDRPSAEVTAIADLHRRWHRSTLGHEDLAQSAEALAAQFQEHEDAAKVCLSASDQDRLVGTAEALFGLNDNLDLASIDLIIDPEVDSRPVLEALWTPLRAEIGARGRHTVHLWTAHRVPDQPDNREPLLPASGVGQIRPDTLTDFLVAAEFTLEQTERYSVLPVVEAADRLNDLGQNARAAAAEYETLSWQGPTPVELRGQLAGLRERMSVDVPSAELALEQEKWDADRVQRADERIVSYGRTRCTTVARHRATGDLVGYTEIDLPRDVPTAGYQEDTLVHGDHRGHRLGMLLKVENLQNAIAAQPRLERVHTWNAGENDHMLAINEALGFVAAGVEGAWQLHM